MKNTPSNKQKKVIVEQKAVVPVQSVPLPKKGYPQYLIFILAFIPAIIPILVYFLVINDYAVNLPYRDDYDAILKFLINLSKSSSLDKISLLFSQHNEHRILSSRLLYYSYYELFTTINLKNIIFIGNAQLIIIFSIFAYFLRKHIILYWGVPILVVSLCIFDINNYENTDWAMACVQNYGVIMFFMLSLLFYNFNDKRALPLAILAQFICAFSSGNGILAGLSIIFFNLLNKDKVKILCSSISFAVFSGLYFYHYISNPNPYMGKHVLDMISYFFGLAGAHFGRDYRIFIGIILYLTIPFLIFSNMKFIIKKEITPFLSMLLFITLSICSTSVFRSGGDLSIDQASYTIRYLIYPHLLAAILFCILAIRLEQVKIRIYILVCLSIVFIKGYKENYDYGEKGYIRINNRLTTVNYNYPDSNYAKKIEVEACKSGIYCIEPNR